MSSNIKIICEIASAHEGDINKLIKLIDFGKQSSCDFVKLQVFNFKNLVDISSKKFQILKKIEFSQDQWKRVFEYCSQSKNKNYCRAI